MRLNAFGTFYLTLTSNGTDNEEELTSDDIKKPRILFRPDKRLQKLIRNLEFEKAKDRTNGNGQAA